MSDPQPTFKKLRFIVGDDGKPYSARWSAWSHRCNVYLLSKPIGHAIKLSLHGDDDSLVCQLGHTDHYYRARIAPLPDASGRSFVRWKRRPTPEQGLLHAVSIQFPADHLTGKPVAGTPGKPLVAFPPGGPGSMVEIGVFYSRISPEESATILQRTSTPIGYFALPNGDNVSVAGRIAKFEPPNLPSGQRLTSGTPIPIHTRHWNDEDKREMIRASENGTVSMIAFNAPADGEVLRIVEMGGLQLARTKDTSSH